MADKLQQEIEELLARLETFPPPRPLRTRIANSIRRFFGRISHAIAGIPLPRLSAGHVLLISIAAIVIGWLALEGTGLGQWLVVGGIVVFIAAFVFSLRRQSHPPQKMWRDRPLDLGGGKSRPWWDRWRTRR